MKKLLAVLMSIVMMFTLAAMPASAADEAAGDEITFDEFVSTVELTVELIKDTLVQVHFIVGSILGILEKECPFCTEIHEFELENGEAEDGVIDQEAPALPEDTEAAA